MSQTIAMSQTILIIPVASVVGFAVGVAVIALVGSIIVTRKPRRRPPARQVDVDMQIALMELDEHGEHCPFAADTERAVAQAVKLQDLPNPLVVDELAKRRDGAQ